jgi:hypothetical protein
MPIPFIIGGAALVAGVWGAVKGAKAKGNYNEAKEMVEEALEDFGYAQSRLNRQKERVSDSLKRLGEVRLETEANLMHRFVSAVNQVNQVSYKPIVLGGVDVQVSEPKLKEIALSAYNAADVMKDGITAVSAGALTGIGASGLATSIGAASTGTAISTLSGVAATNATLAWLGGGSLAAGGMGMTGGMVVLGGAIAGPVIAVMGYAAAAKSEKALTQAEARVSEIGIAIEQIDNGIVVLSAICERCDEIEQTILAVGTRFDSILVAVEGMLVRKGDRLAALQLGSERAKAKYAQKNIFVRIWNRLTGKTPSFAYPDPYSFTNFTEQQQSLYMMLTGFGYSLYSLLKVKVLDDEGMITDESNVAVTDGKNILVGA